MSEKLKSSEELADRGSVVAAAEALSDRGFYVVPIPCHEKGPKLPQWQQLRISKADIGRYFDHDSNVGVILGVPRGLCDVDCDSIESVTVARSLLPDTGIVFGRRSKPSSHYIFYTDPPVTMRRFIDPIDASTIVELRGLKKDKEMGLQTVFPPSVHPSGELIQFEKDTIPAMIAADTITTIVHRIAAAALLAKNWPAAGSGRHASEMALSGALARGGLLEEDAVKFVLAVYRAARNHDPAMFPRVERAVRDTYQAQDQSNSTTGFKTLCDHIDKEVATTALRWLGLEQTNNSGRPGKGPISAATTLLTLVKNKLELFQSPQGKTYASYARTGGIQETIPIQSEEMRLYLVDEYFRATGTAVSKEKVKDAQDTLIAMARASGAVIPVFLRVGEHDHAIFYDLANSESEIVEITKEGWRILPASGAPELRFRRPAGMLAAPKPTAAGNSRERFRALLNTDQDGYVLLLAWLVGCLRPQGPFPLLNFRAEQGTGKSTATKMIRSIIDPSTVPIRSEPRDLRDLMIAANNSWTLALDNLSSMSGWLSDALCRIATGGGFATRQLYTDDGEVLIEAQRPVILNGIDGLCTRSDLIDRAIIVEFPAISPTRRRTEAELWREFRDVHPGILAYLFDALTAALQNSPSVKLAELPRLADFATWAVAAESALDVKPGEFIRLYNATRRDAEAEMLESSTVAGALLRLSLPWTGTVKELLQKLNGISNVDERNPRTWPQTPRGLSSILRRLAPALREQGIDVEYLDRDRSGRQVSLTPRTSEL